MKKFTKLFLLMSVLFFLAHFSFGQIGFGPRIGLNMADLVGINTNSKLKPGLLIGGYAKLGLDDGVAFQTEVLFSMKGYYYRNPSYHETQSLNYLDIPLLINLGKSKGIHFLIGAQPSFLLGAKNKSKFGSSSQIIINNKSTYRGIDVGVVTGLGYQLESGLNFDFRFTYGMVPVFPTSGTNRIHNLNLQLTVGYTLSIK
jgi:hypothetical protein